MNHFPTRHRCLDFPASIVSLLQSSDCVRVAFRASIEASFERNLIFWVDERLVENKERWNVLAYECKKETTM